MEKIQPRKTSVRTYNQMAVDICRVANRGTIARSESITLNVNEVIDEPKANILADLPPFFAVREDAFAIFSLKDTDKAWTAALT